MMRIKCVVLTNEEIILGTIKGHPSEFEYQSYKQMKKPYPERVEEPDLYLTLNQFCRRAAAVNCLNATQTDALKEKIKCMFPPGRIWVHEMSRSRFEDI